MFERHRTICRFIRKLHVTLTPDLLAESDSKAKYLPFDDDVQSFAESKSASVSMRSGSYVRTQQQTFRYFGSDFCW